MTIKELKSVMNGASDRRTVDVLPRYALMAGFYIPPKCVEYSYSEQAQAIDIPADVAKQILAFDFAERATSDLRAMGEGFGKINVTVPSNINVWQHLKGGSAIRAAAKGLQEAAKLLTEKVSQ